MLATTDDYYALLLGLRPTGPAWPADDDQLRAIADGLARAHNRALGLAEESDPRTTSEMLADWERNAGLPDECTGLAETLEGRRLRLVQQLTARGGQSPAYFIGLAETLGIPGATVTEFRPLTCDSACDDSLDSDPWCHVWRLDVAIEPIVTEFMAGSACTAPLRSWGDRGLECVIRRLRPAHTHVLFGYTGVPT